MKKSFLFRCLLAAACFLPMTACTEKQEVEVEPDTTPVTPPPPQHNSLYQTTWAGTADYLISLPIIGDITITMNDTLEFTGDSTATSILGIDAGGMISKDSTVMCTYVWDDPEGVLTAVDNPEVNIGFTKVNSNTINVTITKADIVNVWPAISTFEQYVPETISIDLIKQE